MSGLLTKDKGILDELVSIDDICRMFVIVEASKIPIFNSIEIWAHDFELIIQLLHHLVKRLVLRVATTTDQITQ